MKGGKQVRRTPKAARAAPRGGVVMTTFFSEANRARAKEIVARYPRPKSAILPLAHLAQDQEGWLTSEAMDEIAELTGVTSAEVQGTSSFYTMFKRRPCGKLLVSVCTNVTCLVTGGPEILEHLEEHYATDPDVTVEEVECLAACGARPRCRSTTSSTSDSHRTAHRVWSRSTARVRAGRARSPDRWCDVITQERRIVTKRLSEHPDDSWTIDVALASGAYETLRAVLAKGDPADVQEQVKSSGLRGRGGANFATGQKWSFLPGDLFPRYLVVNGDEGEPSTFKDRMLVERDPHQLVEGIIISAYAIQCNKAFVYLRGEFALGYDRLTRALDDARRRDSWARTSWAPASISRSSSIEVPARTSAVRRPRSSSRSRASGACRA